MIDKPLISVIVPVYNVEPYLNICLESIINQVYDNLEIIIIASTSSDHSVEICNQFIKRDSRIKIIYSEPNGLSDARNKGIEASSGGYICFVDSDDFISSEYIEILYQILYENNCDISQCNFSRVKNNQTIPVQDINNSVKIFSGVQMCYNLYNNLYIQSVVTWSKLYRKKLFDNIRFPVGRIHEDQATTHILFYSANKIAVTDSKLYFYRQVSNSIMGSPYSIKRLDELVFFEEQRLFYMSKGLETLSGLALIRCFYSTIEHIHNVKINIKDDYIITRELTIKLNNYQKMILKNCNMPIITKIKVIINSFFPYKFIISFSKIYNLIRACNYFSPSKLK